MAGNLKRENQDKEEDIVLIKALRDSNIPKFLADDAELFEGILGDLFPGVVIPPENYGVFENTIKTVYFSNSTIYWGIDVQFKIIFPNLLKILSEAGLQEENCTIEKVIQFHETMVVRHGVMLVGPTGSGKTTVLNVILI